MWETPFEHMLRCHILGEETPVTDLMFDMDEAERECHLKELVRYIRLAEADIQMYEEFDAGQAWYSGGEEETGLGFEEWHRHMADQMRANMRRCQAILDLFNGVPDVTPF